MTYMSCRTINTFMDVVDYIIPTQKTLVICDIDDTILLQKVELLSGIYVNTVKWTDYIGFHRLLSVTQEAGGKLMFLTARSPESVPFTVQDFADLELRYDDFEVHYTGNIITKGQYIDRFIDVTPYDRVIFIDDLIPNIYTVKRAVPSAFCFLFCADGV